MKYFYILLIISIFFNCKTNECTRRLPNRPVNQNYLYNTTLIGKDFHIDNAQGIHGIIIYQVGGDKYRVYDLASPHLDIDDANSILQVSEDDNTILENPNDGAKFSLFTGQSINGVSRCPLKEYRVYENSEGGIIVTN